MCDNTLFLCNIWFLYRASFSAALKNIDFSGFSQVFLWQRPIRMAFYLIALPVIQRRGVLRSASNWESASIS